jgi:hypothetical protein
VFYRINEQKNAEIFEDSGERARRILANVYPVDSEVSARYEHPNGITLTISDAQKIGIAEEK